MLLFYLSGWALIELQSVCLQGDAECHVIAAASILAKVTRDRMMLDYDKYELICHSKFSIV